MTHASSLRGCTIKHSVLDLHPEYEPLFEPAPRKAVRGSLDWDGWSWCISNPEAQRVIRELIAEMHENFGNPPYFHIGCDATSRTPPARSRPGFAKLNATPP